MTFFTCVLLGAAGGGIIAALLTRNSPGQRGTPLAVVLGVAAGIYIGFGLQDGRPGQIVLQAFGALPFIAVAAKWPREVTLLGVAWLAHGLWDGMHEIGVIDTRVPPWYPAVCLGWDAILGAAALYWGNAARDGVDETSRRGGQVDQPRQLRKRA